MRRLVKPGNPQPLPADPQSSRSMSSNIHAYVGEFSSNGKLLTTLMLDTEGSFGTLPASGYCLLSLVLWLRSYIPIVVLKSL